MSQRFQILSFCALVTFLCIFYKLGALPFFGADEPRYAQIAQEMLETGDPVTPRLEGRPWLEKPPLLFWIEAISFQLFGVAEWSARLPVALLAVATALCIAFFADLAQGRRTAVAAYLILVTTPMFALFGRAASTDMPLTSMLTAAMVAGYLATRERALRWGILTGLFLGLGILAKGPVAVVLFVGIFLLYFLIRGEVGWSAAQLILGFLTLVTVAVPWFILVWLANGENFILTFWVNHHLARYGTDIHHHTEPVWYFIPILLAGGFPWIFFLGSSLVSMWRERRKLVSSRLSLGLFLWLWVLVPFIFFSLGSSKLPGYILPILPPLVLLAAMEWNRVFRGELAVYQPLKVELALVGAFALILALVLLFGFHFRYQNLLVGLWLALPIAAFAILGRAEFRKRRPVKLFITLVAGISVTLGVLYWKATPVVADFHSTEDLVEIALPRISESEPLVFYRFFHHTARYYADFKTTPESVESWEAFKLYARRHPRPEYLLLTKKNGRQELTRLADASVVARQGDVYLVEVTGPPETWENQDD